MEYQGLKSILKRNTGVSVSSLTHCSTMLSLEVKVSKTGECTKLISNEQLRNPEPRLQVPFGGSQDDLTKHVFQRDLLQPQEYPPQFSCSPAFPPDNPSIWAVLPKTTVLGKTF